MGLIAGIKEYYNNAKIIATRGAMGYERLNVQHYYDGVVKCIDKHSALYPNYYRFMHTVLYGVSVNMDRAEYAHLRTEADKCKKVIDQYETEHFAELVQIWNEERKSERARHTK